MLSEYGRKVGTGDMKKIDILVVGVGGQGTILTGKIISQVALHEGMDVKTAETYGMAQRGGSVVTHVRIASRVYSPLIPAGSVDYLLAFEQLEALRYLHLLRPDTTLIINTQALAPPSVLAGRELYPENIPEKIEDRFPQACFVNGLQEESVKENKRVLNVFLVGILASMLPFSAESWKNALGDTVPANFLPMNTDAFDAGYRWGLKTK